MRYREFPYMQLAKQLAHSYGHLRQDYVFMASNQPAEPSPEELGIELEKADLTWKDPYTPPEVREALSSHYGVRPDQVMSVVGGSSFGNFLYCSLVLGEGGHVVVETPVYDALPGVAEAMGCSIDLLERRADAGFDIDIDRLDALARNDTALVMLTNPHNPSGVELSEERTIELGEWSARRGIPVLLDEVYLDHVPDRKAAAAYGTGLVHTGSLTKVYGIGTWRFGWIIADEKTVMRCERFYDLMGVSMPTIVDWLARGVLRELPAMRRRIYRSYDERKAMVADSVTRMGLSWVEPRYCPFGLLRLPEGVDDVEYCRMLRDDHHVLLAPGSFFRAPGSVRVGWTVTPEQLRTGLDAIESTLS
ncbi:pyridoxal phosphate-dependent aminotransferase [Candidatus Fermentibacterales bacterium]|nr:pyridoxal phosphate-dependent aminotransferase [Candidatus Fermentibacterales bacterium]